MSLVVTDAGPLINLLVIDRADLLKAYPGKIIVTDHVLAEITGAYPTQRERLKIAIDSGWVSVVSISSTDASDAFSKLLSQGRLGLGECAAIAHAISIGGSLLIDDKRAKKSARDMSEKIKIIGTAEFIASLIKLNILTIEQSDLYLVEWAENYRFRLSFKTFAEII